MADIPRAQDQLFDAESSARDKYSRLVVGRLGLGPLIKHEAVVLCSQHVPGALGFASRGWRGSAVQSRAGGIRHAR